MTAGRLTRVVAAARLGLASTLFAAVTVLVGPWTGVAAAQSTAAVLVTVENVSPAVPEPTRAASPMTISVRVTNTTAKAISKIRVTAERDTLVVDQVSLNQQLATTARPTDGLSVPPVDDVVIASLPAHGSVVVPYRITTGTVDGTVSLCLCNQGIYSLYLAAKTTQSDGSARVLGGTRTFVPSIVDSPRRQQVGWLWPLIDRPHRLTSDTVFLDDELADSVRSGGRLDRALQVVQAVGPSVPITLVVDPELLDELEVMSAGYTVESSGASPVQGSGQAAAQDWLERLAEVLRSDASVEITLTPYADPDVRTLADRGQSWTTDLPSPMAGHVTTALAGRAPVYDLAWPSGGVIDGDTVRALSASGATTAVVDQSTLVSAQRKTAITRVRLRSGLAALDTAVTSPAIQRAAASAVTLRSQGLRALPQLLAEIAIRSVQTPTATGFVAIAPPRYVDASPAAAIQAIRATSASLFATPVALRTAIVAATTTGRLGATAAASPLATDITDRVAAIDRDIPAITDILVPSTTVNELVTTFATGRQRLTSSGWRPDVGLGGATLGASLAARLHTATAAVLAGVRIVAPRTRNYTLASSDSTLPIAVRNELTLPVRLRVDVTTQDGLNGVNAIPLTRTVDARSQTSFRIHVTTVVRAGVIPVQAQLATPSDMLLGRPVPLTIHSTALGLVGVIITAVAGGVLVIALLVRLVRRTRQRHRAPPPVPAEREPVS